MKFENLTFQNLSKFSNVQFNLTSHGLNLISNKIIFCILHAENAQIFRPKTWLETNKVTARVSKDKLLESACLHFHLEQW